MDQENREQNSRRRERRTQDKSYMKWLKLGFGITLGVTVICCFIMVAAVNGWLFFAEKPVQTDPVIQTQPETEPPAPTEPPVPDTVVHIIAGGDVNVTDKTVAAGLQNGGYDYTNIFMDTLPVLAGGDITVLNFEGNLYGAPYGKQSAPQELVQALSRAGVDLLQTANSRPMERGKSGLRATLTGIRNAGMTPVGTFANQDEFEKSKGFTLRQVGDLRIAFVAFTKGMDELLTVDSDVRVNLLYKDYDTSYDTSLQKIDTEGIKSVLKSVRAAKPDIIVALVHWGSEDNDNISKTQKKICSLMLEEGVDAILGSHSHQVQQMVFDQEAGTFVAYSLGDFLGDGQGTAKSAYSVLLDLQITKSAKTGEVKITGFDYIPIYRAWEGDTVRILRAREAVAAYESNYIGRVSQETYTAMKAALIDIDKRITAKVP